ncbi:hypothetical protein SBRCBS47491_004145 [Sporothrix bragantina]|uniref:Xylulose kinase n=1 Tax=Sporothrix bragantina TaxID=671064 RepID=A0ABP0BL49_9PEZI
MAAGASQEPLYLGFDLSTQQLKAIVVASDLAIVAQTKVDFDADFGSKYGLTKGVIVNDDEGEVYAPVALFLEAIDLVFARLKALDNGPDVLSRIRAISGSCQQHGSVYWGQGAAEQLADLQKGGSDKSDNKSALKDCLAEAFSRPWAPNWQDHSTQAECDEFDAKLATTASKEDGPQKLAEVTGSAAHHRFTGTQIMRIRRKWPDVYAKTTRISLVSSFVASVLLGSLAPMDISDVCGMDLWDIPNQQWSEPLLELTAGSSKAVGDLRSKLGEVRIDGGGSMGSIASYFVETYGVSPECQIAPFTGDNPATILALPLRPLDAIVSLGTSTTFLMVTPHYKPDPSYHFFNHPTTPGQYMFMLCYKNGGLAREKVRDTLPPATGGDVWANFNKAVLDTPVLGVTDADRQAKLGLYFYINEIVPNIPAGTWRYTCNPADGSNLTPAAAEAHSPKTDAREIVESQALSMRLRSQPLVHDHVPGETVDADANAARLPAQPRRIYLVGGGSLNPAIAQVLGEVLGGAEGVYRLDVGGNACALGGAYKALWSVERRDEHETFDELIGKRWTPEGAIEKVDVGYRPEQFAQYGQVLGAFDQMEQTILAEEQAKRDAKK